MKSKRFAVTAGLSVAVLAGDVVPSKGASASDTAIHQNIAGNVINGGHG